jgi:hypothetical protein
VAPSLLQFVDWSPSIPPRDPKFPPINKQGDASQEVGSIGLRGSHIAHRSRKFLGPGDTQPVGLVRHLGRLLFENANYIDDGLGSMYAPWYAVAMRRELQHGQRPALLLMNNAHHTACKHALLLIS